MNEKPTPEESIETARREFVKQTGRFALAAPPALALLLSTAHRDYAMAGSFRGGGGGNPGNHKPVGNAGENPNGKGSWGPGDKGMSNGNSGKPAGTPSGGAQSSAHQGGGKGKKG